MKHIRIVFYVLFFFSPLCCLANPDMPIVAKHGMVVSEQKLASQVGVDILRAGGNAIDAAVAVGYALAVVNPCCGNLGGGGFMTIHLAKGDNIFLNFREKAPLKASKTMYLDAHGKVRSKQSTTGYLSVAVPGTVMGLETARQRYGTLSRQQLMAPAIRLAQQGYLVTTYDAQWFSDYAKDFRKQPSVAAIFLKKGQPYRAGERLIQRDLAHTLQEISDKGTAAFYDGPIALAIIKASQAQGGLLSLADFTHYTVQESKPIQCQYHGYTLISSAPPSSGGVTLCEMLNILDNIHLNRDNYDSLQTTRTIIEVMRYAFIDRNRRLGDPDFVNNPLSTLLSPAYAKKISERIKQAERAQQQSLPSLVHEKKQTTHYSIVDGKGNAVAVTYTLNGFFGARVIASPTGFFLNNEMDDFAAKAGSANKFGLVQYDANTIAPGKRPLSSMTPTIIMKDGRVFMVVGSPGGPRIITAVLLTILNVIDGGMNIQQAVNKPRFHYQAKPDVISAEPLAFTPESIKKLTGMGYHIKQKAASTSVESILIDPATGLFYGANDNRRPDGAALGY
jgi:gamma-glutamyltranspeptidase / glutathione hydrolase